jgi:hypothetical protein
MKTRHAAALALVGWYLMLPPPISRDFGNEHGPFDLGAPLNTWMLYASTDSARECNDLIQENIKNIRKPNGPLPKGYVRLSVEIFGVAECIASDDPRLKGK